MAVQNAYDQASGSGLYQKPSGLHGKYDNVRRFWEDTVTRIHVRPYLERLARGRAGNGGLRILDLGCGSGDGYELLFGPVVENGVEGGAGIVFPRELLAEYAGVDVNGGLLEQGRSALRGEDRARFLQGDFLRGLPVAGEPAYELYLANYGTLSHCRDSQLVGLLADIAAHARHGSLVIGDWLGCYAYEWQDYWVPEPLPDYNIPYVISYLYPERERARLQLDAFRLRLMHPEMLRGLVREAGDRAGVNLEVLGMFDRSILVGRHIETGDYHPTPQPLRTLVNSLLEPDRITDLNRLTALYEPKPGFEALNDWFLAFQQIWNGLIRYTQSLLTGQETGAFDELPAPAARAAETIRLLVERTRDLELEEVRAGIIEPQLAYALRRLECELQQGMGVGHGLTAVLEVRKE